MQIDVRALLQEGPGGSLERSLQVEPVTLTIAGETVRVDPERPLSVRLAHTGDGILVQARMSATLQLRCTRCLKPHTAGTRLIFEELHLTKRQPEEEAELREVVLHGGDLDLAEGFRQSVVLAVPLRHVCDETCQGLCPQCGTDLNETSCACEPQSVDPRFAKLDRLRQQLAEEEE